MVTEYVANVTSDLQLQQSFIVLQATDSDIGQNAEIEYSLIEDANGAFNITPSSGYVFLANTLTQGVPETIGAGQVVIPDLSCNSSVSNTRVEFQLMRADGTPALQTEFFSIRANGNSVSVLSTGNFDYEKATQHTVRIRCLLTFAITDENGGSNDFEIVQNNNDNTAVVRTKRTFDREIQQYYPIFVVATDVTVSVEITISDINDNPPSFNQTIYHRRVNEELLTDQGRLQYLIVSGNERNTFGVKAGTGALFVLRRLDYEGSPPDRSFTLRLQASDRKFSAETTVVVEVDDVNDNFPVFHPQTQDVNDVVEEDDSITSDNPRLIATVSTSVVLIQAGDPDYQENGTVSYAIDRIFSDQGDKTGYFTINGQGLIKTNVRTVTINLGDINDNVPIFEQLIYTRTIQENHPLTVEIVSVAANDKDEKPTLYYSFSEDTNIFRVVDTRSNTGSVRLYQELDYENADQRFFNLTVIVRDENPAHTASCYVEITVTDFNDNAPVIVPEDHSVSVKEDISPGTWLANFTASDKDSGINSEFEFAIDRQSDRRRFFSINATTGEVHTRRKLDRETVPQHVLTILAIDKGDPPLTGTAKLTVNLEDVNDNYPTFLEDYQPHVQENLPAISNREVQLIFGFDPDGSPFGPPFGFAEPTCGDGGNGTGLVTTSNTFDREQQKYYTIPIVMWDMRGVNQALSKTGTNTLTVTIADVNDNPQSPGHQDVFVYNYKGLFGDFVIGRVVDPNLGDITMKKGVPSNTFTTPYKFEVDVYDRVDDTTVRSTVSVVIHELSEQAVMSSGAVRLTGTSAEEFIKRSQNGAGESKYDNFRTLMAAKLGVDVNNVEIISVMDVGEFTDVRYSAHGSPYYQSSQTDSVVVINKQEFENLGLSIAEVPIDACAEEEFEGGCYNFLNITGQPAVVNSNGTSFVGVEVMVQAREGCRALEYPDPVECSGDYCYNGGTCLKDDFGVLRKDGCQCHDGFDGSRCQQLRHSFDGNSFAMYPTLEQCEDSQTSIEFITTQDDGLLLYNGPIAEVVGDQPRDFITLQLVSGYPVLYIDHGSGHLRLSLNSIKLSDGAWHRIDILRTGRLYDLHYKKMPSVPSGENGCQREDYICGTKCETTIRDLREKSYLEWTLEESFTTAQRLAYQMDIHIMFRTRDDEACIQDIRLNNVWFPMKTNENSITQGVSQTGEQGVSDGCQRLWYGQYCQFYGKQDDDDVVGAGLTAGGIAAIVVSIIVVLLIVLLAFILLNYFRKRQTDREKIVFENDDDYDIRENVMFYDEEGAGEEDQEAYDLAKLPPVESETALRPQKAPRNKTLPARRGIPDDRPDVGGVLSDRLRDAEDDPDAPPYDTTQAFNDEGSGSTAGSLSSLNTTSSDASQDYDYLNDWGPKFAKLADMYGAGHNEPEDL
nr:hypothetical protein BaRGS_034073 [Batillaria attramentaria]